MTWTRPIDAPTRYDLEGWPPAGRDALAALVQQRGIDAHWVDRELTVPAADRAQVDDLIAYLNGSAWPGVIATAPRGVVAAAAGPPPAWHPNPEDPSTWRWWDGARWTSFTQPAPVPARPWFPGRRATEVTDRSLAMKGGVIALVGFVVAQLLSVGAALLAIALGAEERSVVTLVVSGVALWSGLLATCLVAVRRHGTGSLRDLGLAGIRRSDIGTGVVASIVARVAGAAAAAALILVLPDETYGNGTSIVDRGRPSTLALIVVALFVVVGAPFFEELFFRGLVQGALTGRTGARAAVVVQAILFASAHYQIGMSVATIAITFVVIGIAGLTLGMVRWHTERLGAGMVAHAAFNLVAVVLLLFVL